MHVRQRRHMVEKRKRSTNNMQPSELCGIPPRVSGDQSKLHPNTLSLRLDRLGALTRAFRVEGSGPSESN